MYRYLRKYLRETLEGRRRMGRPKLRCLEDAEKNLRQTKVKRRRENAVEREE
jgi:hypothetical protein